MQLLPVSDGNLPIPTQKWPYLTRNWLTVQVQKFCFWYIIGLFLGTRRLTSWETLSVQDQEENWMISSRTFVSNLTVTNLVLPWIARNISSKTYPFRRNINLRDLNWYQIINFSLVPDIGAATIFEQIASLRSIFGARESQNIAVDSKRFPQLKYWIRHHQTPHHPFPH